MLSKRKENMESCSINKIDFIDLKAQQEKIRTQLDDTIRRVLDHGIYIMGPEVAQLEAELSKFCGVKHSISCANGTDALGLALMAMDVTVGDAVFVPSFTFAATAEVVAWVGATPIFVDSLPNTYNMDPESLEQGIKVSLAAGLKPTCIITVDLFGLPVDYDAIESIAEAHNMWVLSDAAQSFGGSYKDRMIGNIGHIATTSFFPAKPLGCYGDGGAVFTNDDIVAAKIKSLRVHGQGADKYDNVRIGMNGRLDTIQAAVLIEKLKLFKDELVNRQKASEYYNKHLTNLLQKPELPDGSTSAWAQYTVVLPDHINRSDLMNFLKEQGIPTFIYYIKPLHLQSGYKNYPSASDNGLPICERLAERVLSLPMHGYLTEAVQNYIIKAVNEYIGH